MLLKLSSARKKEPGDLVDMLLECHERIRSFVSLAGEAATRFEAPVEEIVEACTSVERYFTEALPLHVADEEESILPRLWGQAAEVDVALKTMKEQHDRHGPILRSLLDASSAVRKAPHDRALRATLSARTTELAREFTEHLTLEEALIFPAIRRLFSADLQAQIVSELRARRAPPARNDREPP